MKSLEFPIIKMPEKINNGKAPDKAETLSTHYGEQNSRHRLVLLVN